jgi:hypothetical protein
MIGFRIKGQRKEEEKNITEAFMMNYCSLILLVTFLLSL